MRKVFLLCFLLSSFKLFAANGDTTWVNLHQGTWLSYYGNYDTVVELPDASKTYQRIILEWTIGKYVCPGSPQYCSDWDYDVHYKIMPPAGSNHDTLEIARLITPYGKGPRMNASWTHRYYFDVTDYYPLLKDSVTARMFYSGYSGGFTGTSRLCFIEGRPPRDVISVKRLWTGSKQYGNATVSIDSLVKPISITAPALAQAAKLKVLITGHGADNTGCSEFCSKWYEVVKDNTVLYHKDIWKNDCGFNNLYPQSGTWIYDRANWCPGDQVGFHEFDIPNVTASATYDIDLAFEPYVLNGGSPSYNLEAHLFHYGPMNKNLDVRLDDIIAPSDYEGHYRSNPICNEPKIKVSNVGRDTINTLTINYQFPKTNGNYTVVDTLVLLPNTSTEITLPSVIDLSAATGDSNIIKVTVRAGAGDDQTNNTIEQKFTATPHWPKDLVIQFKTNNVIENRWRLFDQSGQIVHQRDGLAPNTTYRDTLNLAPGCYKFQLIDDGCDGLRWWANSGQGTGTIKIFGNNNITAPLPIKGYYNTNNNYEGDFGCEIVQNFVVEQPSDIQRIKSKGTFGFSINPNPAQNEVYVAIQKSSLKNTKIRLSDIHGKTIQSMMVKENQAKINTQNLSSGVYIITCENDGQSAVQKLVISK